MVKWVRWLGAGVVAGTLGLAALCLPAAAGAQITAGSALSVAKPTVASPPTQSVPFTPAKPVAAVHLTRSKAGSQIPSYAITWYENHFGVSAAVATANLETQSMGQGLEQQLDNRFGNAIADVWFNNTTGKWVIDATSTPTTTDVQAVADADNLGSNYEVDRVDYTRSDLTNEVKALGFGLSADPGFDAVGISDGAVEVDVSSQASATDRARLSADAETPAGAGTTSSAPPIHTKQLSGGAPKATVSCSFPNCDTIIGGDNYTQNGVACTMSWPGQLSDGQRVVLTAGHCAEDMGQGNFVLVNDLIDPSLVPFGYIYLGAFGTGGDWGYIDLDDPPTASLDPGRGYPYGGYVNWASEGLSPLESYYTEGTPPAGTEVCLQGVGSGENGNGDGSPCGILNAGDQTVTISGGPTLTGMVRMDDVNACFGDSGGPWDLASADTAVAIQSAADIATGANCGGPAWATPVSIPIQNMPGGLSLQLGG